MVVYPRKKKYIYCSEKFTYIKTTKKTCLLVFIPSRRMHGNYQEAIISSSIVRNNTTNSDFSNNRPLNVAISIHSNSLWDLAAPARLSFPKDFSSCWRHSCQSNNQSKQAPRRSEVVAAAGQRRVTKKLSIELYNAILLILGNAARNLLRTFLE